MRRLLFGVLTLLAAVSLVFMMVHMIPGDPVHSILGDTYSLKRAIVLLSNFV